MADIRITIQGIDKVRAAFAKFPDTIGPHLRDASMKSAFLIEGAAKKLSPVDTGRMRASIATSLGIRDRGITAIVQTNVHYAIHVHEGTKRMKKRPFMKQGAESVSGRIGSIYESEMNKAMQKVANLAK
jgi:HK97 gp10 family phage protein